MNKVAKLFTALFICTLTTFCLKTKAFALYEGNPIYTVGDEAKVEYLKSGNFTLENLSYVKSDTKWFKFKITYPNGQSATYGGTSWSTMTSGRCAGYIGNQYVTAYLGNEEWHVDVVFEDFYTSGFSLRYREGSTDADICSQKGIVPHRHSWDEGIVTLEPTIDSEGERKCSCSICGDTKIVSIPKKEDILEPEPTPEPTPDPVPTPEPEPEPEPYNPQPIIHYDGMETISENSLKFYEDVGNEFRELNGNIYALSLSVNRIDERLKTLDEIKDLTASVSANTAELVRLNTNDINNEEMLDQLSGNIEDLNTRLTELSVYLGYFFAFMIFLIIVIIFRATWKLIDKYLLNQTLR